MSRTGSRVGGGSPREEPPEPTGPGHAREAASSRGGFSLIELIVILMIIGTMTGIVTGAFNEYRDRAAADRGAQVVGSYITLARSIAIQQRTSVTLEVNPTEKRLVIRTRGDTLESISFATGSELPLSTLDTNIPGDTLTFIARGVCAVCGVDGYSITVASPGATYIVTFNGIGRWQRNRQ